MDFVACAEISLWHCVNHLVYFDSYNEVLKTFCHQNSKIINEWFNKLSFWDEMGSSMKFCVTLQMNSPV